MAAAILELRAAVVGRLAFGQATGVFGSANFTPRAAMTFDLKQVDTRLDVVVIGVGRETDQAARDTDDRDYTIEIGVCKKLSAKETDEAAEDLVELVEKIADYLRSDAGTLDTVPDGGDWSPIAAQWQSSAIDPLYDFASLRKFSRFASSQRIVYRLTRDRDEGADV